MTARRAPLRPSKALLKALDGNRLDRIAGMLQLRPRPKDLIARLIDIVEASGRRTEPETLRAHAAAQFRRTRNNQYAPVNVRDVFANASRRTKKRR